MDWNEMPLFLREAETEISGNRCKLTYELLRPCNIKKPKVFKDGNAWCALLGEDLMNGVYGFGNTPEEACKAFDKAWVEL